MSEKIDVAVNGFGRIGTLYSRIAIDDPETHLTAINIGGNGDEHDTAVRLDFDSNYRGFGDHEIAAGDGCIIVDSRAVVLESFRDLAHARWSHLASGITVIESTGANLTTEKVRGHLDAGAKNVVITAPARDERTPTLVMGVNDNEETLDTIDKVVAVSSCSTNCIAPIMKIMDDAFDLKWGTAKTPHAYTNSQRALDGRGKDAVSRRGLDALIPASTGSAREVIRLFPHLDFFRAESMRVPVAVGSVAMLSIGIQGEITKDDVTEVIDEAIATSHQGIIGSAKYSMYSPRVIGRPESSVIDTDAISVDYTNGQSIVNLQAWFDNEWGYANRVADVVKLINHG